MYANAAAIQRRGYAAVAVRSQSRRRGPLFLARAVVAMSMVAMIVRMAVAIAMVMMVMAMRMTVPVRMTVLM